MTTVLDEYLNPITPENPAGEDLKYDVVYDQIREAMREEDPGLPLGVWIRAIKYADWSKTADLCTNALKNRTKDLQISAWLIQAWMHQNGMTGITQGLQLLLALTEKFWDDAYPKIAPDGDMGFRISPFLWINDKLSAHLQFVAITQPQAPGEMAYTFADWISVSKLKDLYQVPDRPKQAGPLDQVGSNIPPTLLDFSTNLDRTPTAFLQDLQQQVALCVQTCQSLEKFLEEKDPADPMSFFRLKNFFQDLTAFLTQTLYERAPVSNAPPAAPMPTLAPASPDGGASLPPPAAMTADLRGRDQAYQTLSDAADFLTKIEPHSPVPYLIKRAVSWRDKSFMDVLQEMMGNSADVASLHRILGIAPEEE